MSGVKEFASAKEFAGVKGKRITFSLIFSLLFLILLTSGCGEGDATTVQPKATHTEAPVEIPSVTSTLRPASTSTPSPSPSPTVVPTNTPTVSPTATLDIQIEATAEQYSLGEERERPSDEMVMLYVPGGEFKMGSTPGDLDYPLKLCDEYYGEAFGGCERRWWDNERPAHTVTVDGFWIDRTEVTSGQFRRCVEAGDCEPPTRDIYYSDQAFDDHPVVYVTWHQASAYCEWAEARLPTEAEWEYAARGPDSLTYPWGNEFDGTRVNYCDLNCEYDWPDISVDDGYGRTAPVGAYPEGASWSGALDMSGNVWEWAADWYNAGYFASSPSQNPTGPESGVERVRRGGSWHYSADGVRGTSRFGVGPDGADNFQGFRCAKTF